jgi:hypothetical protein
VSVSEPNDPEALLGLLPPIRRARFWRLYAEDGRRFLDLWMDGGRAILGAKGTGIGTVVKAAVDLGLARPLPSIRSRRLERELFARWPGWAAVRLYRDEGRALAALARALGPAADPSRLLLDPARRPPDASVRPASPSAGPSGSGAEPAFPGPRTEPAALVLRPFADALGDIDPAPALPAALPLLPCPRAFAPCAILFRDPSLAERAGESDLVPPMLLAAASRSLAELARFSRTYGEAHWRRVDRRLGPFFERRGPYLYARATQGDYEALFRAALGSGVLLSPDPGLPSIVPGDFDDGELAALAKALG